MAEMNRLMASAASRLVAPAGGNRTTREVAIGSSAESAAIHCWLDHPLQVSTSATNARLIPNRVTG